MKTVGLTSQQIATMSREQVDATIERVGETAGNGERENSQNSELEHRLSVAHQHIRRLERKVNDHRQFWVIAASIVAPLALYCFFYREPPKEFWEGANRCQTLWLMDKAARENLADEQDLKTIVAAKAVREALGQCSQSDLRGDADN